VLRSCGQPASRPGKGPARCPQPSPVYNPATRSAQSNHTAADPLISHRFVFKRAEPLLSSRPRLTERRHEFKYAGQGRRSQEVHDRHFASMPEGERGAAAATGESSTTLLVGPACSDACSAISVPRAKAAPRRTSVLSQPTLAYQHEQPSHTLNGWQPSAPSRSPSGNGFDQGLRRRGFAVCA